MKRPFLTLFAAASVLASATLPASRADNDPVLATANQLEQLQKEITARGELAQRQAERAQELMQLAQARAEAPEADLPEPPEPPEPPAMPEFGELVNDAMATAFAVSGDIAGRSSTAPLVISSAVEPGALAELQEDLAVMNRILTKGANQAAGTGATRLALGIALQTPFGSRSPQCLYLEGFGAVFMLSANYPLLAPSVAPDVKEDGAKPDNTAWEEARSELYGGRAGNSSTAHRYGEVGARRAAAGNPLEYDAGRVEKLKTALLEAAKNAANIRHLKPAEHIVIAVRGSGQSTAKRGPAHPSDRSGRRVGVTAGAGEPQTTLTIRFSKESADAFAKGQLRLEEFTKKATIAAY